MSEEGGLSCMGGAVGGGVQTCIKPNLPLCHFGLEEVGGGAVQNKSCSEWPETHFDFGIFES